MKKRIFSIILAALILSSCSEEPQESAPSNQEQTNETETSNSTSPKVEEDDNVNQDSEISSRYHYDEDWEVFKTAVINKDIKGVAAFASSDNIDAEIIVEAFSDPDFLSVLKNASYDDLEVDTSGEEVMLVFSCAVEGDDGEGNIFESGLYLYFTQGETGLLLENFLAAG